MNLGKLLSVGKSIFGSGDAAAYRLSRRAHLPKFNEGKNPFAPKAPEAPVEPAKAKVVAPVAAVGPKAPPPYAFKPVRSGKWPASSVPASETAARPARPGWTARLNPFRAPEPASAQSPAAVQAELSLDAVKVVHNDLADADVEVVPVKSHTEAVGAAPLLPPARRAWEYMGEHLLKS
ncbi:MAG: hypothetical protein ABSH48_01475 [Verrucomicrobiota bacterium]